MADINLIYRVVKCIFAGIGLIANVALFVIYLKKDRKVRFNLSMLMIITWDLLFILFTLLDVKLEFTTTARLGENLDVTLGRILEFMSYFTFGGSVYTTTLTAVERHLILCKDV